MQDQWIIMQERRIMEEALANFEKQTGVHGTWTQGNEPVDGEMRFMYNDVKYLLPVEVKKEVRGHQLAQLVNLKNAMQELLLVAEYIYPKLKEELRAKGINYLETNGNVYIKKENLFLWVDNAKVLRTEAPAGRAFAKTGLRLVFQLLLDETLLNHTYREMAEKTGVGFGNINFILTDLKEQGFLLPVTKDTFRLTRKKQLLEKFIQVYVDKLQPALQIGTFRFARKEDYINWQTITLTPGETFWGGEPAGGVLTGYLQPEKYTLYTTESRGDLLRKYRLAPADNGDVKVYEKFWNIGDDQLKTVPPLLVYTDLINSDDRRCLQTAEKIYNEYLQREF